MHLSTIAYPLPGKDITQVNLPFFGTSTLVMTGNIPAAAMIIKGNFHIWIRCTSSPACDGVFTQLRWPRTVRGIDLRGSR